MTEQQNKTIITLPSDREIVITRVFNAPREMVFKAHIDPALIPRWWGPRHTTTIVEKMDVRPAGEWRFIHHTGDGKEFGYRGEFREITPPERIVQTSEFEEAMGHIVLETITFEEQDGKTKMIVVDLFESMEDRDMALQSGMESGLAESYERLEELATQLSKAWPREIH